MLAISQLPSRYAQALDARDLDPLVGLFVPDVAGGRYGAGRDGLRTFYETVLRNFYRSVHLICGHTYDFDDQDHAHGVVYCRAEHEDRDGWYVMTLRYLDVYERRDGQWYFTKRRESFWYANDVLQRPGDGGFQAWSRLHGPATLPHAFPTWEPFWDRDGDAPASEVTRWP